MSLPDKEQVLEIKASPEWGDPKLWVLHYRQGSNPAPMWKNFYHKGSLSDVINRAKEHCQAMNFKFISVRNGVNDLAEDEKRYTSQG